MPIRTPFVLCAAALAVAISLPALAETPGQIVQLKIEEHPPMPLDRGDAFTFSWHGESYTMPSGAAYASLPPTPAPTHGGGEAPSQGSPVNPPTTTAPSVAPPQPATPSLVAEAPPRSTVLATTEPVAWEPLPPAPPHARDDPSKTPPPQLNPTQPAEPILLVDNEPPAQPPVQAPAEPVAWKPLPSVPTQAMADPPASASPSQPSQRPPAAQTPTVGKIDCSRFRDDTKIAAVLDQARKTLAQAQAIREEIDGFEANWLERHHRGGWDCPSFNNAYGVINPKLRQIIDLNGGRGPVEELSACLDARLSELAATPLNTTSASWRKKYREQAGEADKVIMEYNKLRNKIGRLEASFQKHFITPCTQLDAR